MQKIELLDLTSRIRKCISMVNFCDFAGPWKSSLYEVNAVCPSSLIKAGWLQQAEIDKEGIAMLADHL